MPSRPLSIRIATAGALACMLVFAGCRRHPATGPVEKPLTPLQLALQSDAGKGQLGGLHWPNFSDYRPAVQVFYKNRDWQLAWVHHHQPTRQAAELAILFEQSAGKGLNPEDYDASQWHRRLHSLTHASDQQLAAFDAAVTVSAMRYISDLHIGRVNPEHFDFGVDIDAKKYNLPDFVAQQVVRSPDVNQSLAGIEPTAPGYVALLHALNQYQQLAAQTADAKPLPIPAAPLTAGQHYAGAAALAARLTLLGDLPSEDAAASETYSQALAQGVRSFQSRHGFTPTGRLTPGTVAAINVPLSSRVQQMEDALERWRWLAPEYQNARVIVNIPEFVMRTYGDDGKLAFAMKVVVGEAKDFDHQTPVVAKMMRYLVFRPFWVVTPTIIKKELVPHVESDKDYLADKNFEVITRAGKPAPDWTVDGLAHGRYMVREKPGPQNSLGLVKFMFPNKLNIYIHSTPALQLFAHSRRDYSHGCVRLQDAEKMADWVLADEPKWTPDAIHDAMENGQDNKTVGLLHPLPVVIFYATAEVGDDGKVYFFDDLYGYDKDMEGVLAAGDPFPVKPEVKKQASDTV